MPKVAYHADIAAMSGKQGGQVYAQTRQGGVRKSRVIPMNPNTTAQVAARKAFAQGAVAYSQLSASHVAQWEQYAATLKVTDPTTGRAYSPAPGTVFTGLTAKFLQASPKSAAPLTPPTSGFAGDTITVGVSAFSHALLFTSSGANAAGVQTEILLQKLPMTNRKPDKNKYRVAGFMGFQTEGETFTAAVGPGRYACAYKFILVATGQVSLQVPLGIVDVA